VGSVTNGPTPSWMPSVRSRKMSKIFRSPSPVL